jgi:serine/threonine-protein kinase
MVRVRLLLAVFLLIAADAAVSSRASAAEWPAERQFVLVEPPPPLHLYPPPSSVVEDSDGALLVLVYWPVTRRTDDGSISERPRTRLVRIAPDGVRAFVPPFGAPDPGSVQGRVNVDDEILPLPDGSILFTRYNAIDQLGLDGSIVRFAGTGRYNQESSGDGGPATAADIESAHGLSRFPDGSVVFGDRHRVRRVGPDGIITTIAGTGEFGFGGDGGPATAAQFRFPSDVLPTEVVFFIFAVT